MKPKLDHQKAMEFSFKAKQALEQENYSAAFDLFIQAADLESKVAEFYFDKPTLEPTRSIIIRSAAFLNIKAGQIEQAKKFIFFGLLNCTDILIKEQLNNALELAVSLGNLSPDAASREINYLNLLRQRSIHYVIEPANLRLGHSVSLESIKDFSESYLKSLKAFAFSKFKKVLKTKEELDKNIKNLINPLITSSSFGSFKFSIANDYLDRGGDKDEIVEIKSNIVSKYHNEIFINPLSDEEIVIIKKNYTEEEVNEIFRPLTKIKSNNCPYKVGYYDSEDFNKKFVSKIENKQKQKLISVKQISEEDIGALENQLVHKQIGKDGRTSKKVLYKVLMKIYEFCINISEINPKGLDPILLAEEIMVSINFDSNKGFTIAFEDLNIQNTDISYEKALDGFHKNFYNKLKKLANESNEENSYQNDLKVANTIIGNLKALAD
ncbi:MAG: hypothetical protein ORN58_08400 [Sediminibacterium sp.]|nr:hypothetical protein [Sediminibacterium sp.]